MLMELDTHTGRSALPGQEKDEHTERRPRSRRAAASVRRVSQEGKRARVNFSGQTNLYRTPCTFYCALRRSSEPSR